MKNFSEAPIKPDISEATELPEAAVDFPREAEEWQGSIELPEDVGDWVGEIELPEEFEEWEDKIDLFDFSASNEGGKEVNDSRDENGDSLQELTEDEIDEAQHAAIQEAFERISRGEELTNAEKGNLCEMMMDQYYISKGYKPLHDRVTSLNHPGHKGIDGVYEKQNSDGAKQYIIADAKYGSSTLDDTTDGRQLSDTWIDARLDGAVGKEKADEIRDAYEDDSGSMTREVYHYSPYFDENGNTYTDVSSVDPTGTQSREKRTVEIIDECGNATVVSEDMDRTMKSGENNA